MPIETRRQAGDVSPPAWCPVWAAGAVRNAGLSIAGARPIHYDVGLLPGEVIARISIDN